jgi:Predicted membrane protein
MRTRARRIAALSAPVGVALSVSGILAVGLLVPFDPVTQAISELGDPLAPYSSVFNASFILAGLVALPFAAVLAVEARNAYERVGAVFVGVSFVALSAIGLFPIGNPYHTPAALSYYTAFTFALWVHGTGETVAGDTRRGLVAVWLGNANIIVWATWAFWSTYAPGLAVPEALGASGYILWVFVTARRLYAYNSEA